VNFKKGIRNLYAIINHEFIFDQRHLELSINYSNSVIEAQNLLKISYYKNLPRALSVEISLKDQNFRSKCLEIVRCSISRGNTIYVTNEAEIIDRRYIGTRC